MAHGESLSAAIRIMRRAHSTSTIIAFDSYLRAKSLIMPANPNHDDASLFYAWKAEVVLVMSRSIIEKQQKLEYAFDALRYSISNHCNCGTISNRCNQRFDMLRGNERRIRTSEEQFLSAMSRMSASPIIVKTLQSMGGRQYAEGSCAFWEVLKGELRIIEYTRHIELPELALPSNATLVGSAVELLCRKGAVAKKIRGEKAADLRCGTRWL